MLDASELADMRATSTRALPDTVTVTRPSTVAGGIDPTGTFVPAPAATVYVGPGRLRPPISTREMASIFGDVVVTETRYVLTVPYDTAAVELGDMVAVSVGSDPTITGRAFRVVRNPAGSWLIDRRLGVEATEQ